MKILNDGPVLDLNKVQITVCPNPKRQIRYNKLGKSKYIYFNFKQNDSITLQMAQERLDRGKFFKYLEPVIDEQLISLKKMQTMFRPIACF